MEARDELFLRPILCGIWRKLNSERMQEAPAPRVSHTAVYHKNSIYIFGGLISLEGNADYEQEHRVIYSYSLVQKRWSRMQTNFLGSNSFEPVFGHSCILHNNLMYLFGGRSTTNGDYLQGLWGLNLESLNWKKQDHKGRIPPQRERAEMVFHMKNKIFLFGGLYLGRILNDMYLYECESRIWLQIEEGGISQRVRPALCSYGDYIYVFGGCRTVTTQLGEKKNIILSDFYQISVAQRSQGYKLDLVSKRIISNLTPAGRAQAILTPYNDKYLILCGGNNQYEGISVNSRSVWFFNVVEVKWTMVQLHGSQPIRQHFILLCISERCYIFGGVTSKGELSGDGMKMFHVQSKDLEKRIQQISKKKPKDIKMLAKDCKQCYEADHILSGKRLVEYSVFKEIIQEKLQFPFAALGLLIDNALLLRAKECRVSFTSTTTKDKCIVVDDDGEGSHLWATHQEFMEDMHIFKTYVEENIDQLPDHQKQENHPQMLPEDPNTPKSKEDEREVKKERKRVKRERHKRNHEREQFSRNLKLGGLRLGDRVIFVSRFGVNFENRRVFMIQKAKSAHDDYRTFCYSIINGVVCEQLLQTHRKYVEEECRSLYKLATDKRNANNICVVGGLKLSQEESELKMGTTNDVYFGQTRLFQQLIHSGYEVADCIDVSLKCYLGLLYLKSDPIRIYLTVFDCKTEEISNSKHIGKIDNLLKTNKITELTRAFDEGASHIMEIYHNSSLRKKCYTFHNGVLIYYQNRLIMRYKYNLGELIKVHRNKLKGHANILPVFGFIELKGELQPNMFKTNFHRDGTVEAMLNRIKFIENYALRNGKNTAKVNIDQVESKKDGDGRSQGKKDGDGRSQGKKDGDGRSQGKKDGDGRSQGKKDGDGRSQGRR